MQVAVQSGADPALGPTIAECSERYLEARKHELRRKAYGQHKLLLERLQEFCKRNGVIYAKLLTVDC